MLIKTLALSVATLEDLPSLVPRLQSLAARHIRYGSTIAQYGAVGEALVWALQTVAGESHRKTATVKSRWLFHVRSSMLQLQHHSRWLLHVYRLIPCV